MATNLYQFLGVKQTATTSEIKSAYRRAVRIAHPDTGGNDELFRKVQEAYEVLSVPSKRSSYDAQIRPRVTTYANASNDAHINARNEAIRRQMARERAANLARKQARDLAVKLAEAKREDQKWLSLSDFRYRKFRYSKADYFLVKSWQNFDVIVRSTLILAMVAINIAMGLVQGIIAAPEFSSGDLSFMEFLVSWIKSVAIIDVFFVVVYSFVYRLVWKQREEEYMPTSKK